MLVTKSVVSRTCRIAVMPAKEVCDHCPCASTGWRPLVVDSPKTLPVYIANVGSVDSMVAITATLDLPTSHNAHASFHISNKHQRY